MMDEGQSSIFAEQQSLSFKEKVEQSERYKMLYKQLRQKLEKKEQDI